METAWSVIDVQHRLFSGAPQDRALEEAGPRDTAVPAAQAVF